MAYREANGGDEELQKAEIGIIGGSGLYDMAGLTNVREERVETPFRAIRAEVFVLGELEGRSVAFSGEAW